MFYSGWNLLSGLLFWLARPCDAISSASLHFYFLFDWLDLSSLRGELLSCVVNGWLDFVSLAISFLVSDLRIHACEAGGAALCTATLTR